MIEITLGNYEFEFDSHQQGYGGPEYVCVNVKNHGFQYVDHLSEEHRKRLDLLTDSERERIELDAWSVTAEDWWDWAREIASDKGLGTIYSAGRSGGYLVLNEWDQGTIDLYKDEYEEECVHCSEHFDDHVKGRCVFGPTQFESTREHLRELLEEIRDFLQDMGESAKNSHVDMAGYVEMFLSDYTPEET